MNIYLGITDTNWYNYLRKDNPEDINFWQPGGHSSLKVLERGAPFLFKLKYHMNAIAGVGFFVSHTHLPLSIAWDTFGNGNGSDTYVAFKSVIMQYRKEKNDGDPDPIIGCIVLASPIFFDEKDWIPAPMDWSKNIVSGKTYSTDEPAGRAVWKLVEECLAKYHFYEKELKEGDSLVADPDKTNRYGSYITKVRLGQGAFHLLVTDTYERRCAVTRERTLPVLEVAHIKPYAESGPHAINNGLLLRSDMHKLFDSGYITVSEDYSIEVSKRIKEEYENGKEYYRYHGKKLMIIPDNIRERPSGSYLVWHNENVFRG